MSMSQKVQYCEVILVITNKYIDVMDYMEDIKLMNNLPKKNNNVLLNISNHQKIFKMEIVWVCCIKV